MNCQYKGVELTKEEQLRYEIERLRSLLREVISGLAEVEPRLEARIESALAGANVQPPAVLAWGSNPLQDVLDTFARLYPNKAATVYIAPTEAGLGFTEFPDDGSSPSICVDPGLPYSGVMDILAHELAHVAAGSAEEHGAAWQAAYDAIRDGYEREVMARGDTVAYSPEGERATNQQKGA
jgi:hypothetical protein